MDIGESRMIRELMQAGFRLSGERDPRLVHGL